MKLKVKTYPVIKFTDLAKLYEETYDEELYRSDVAGDEFCNNSYTDLDLEDLLWDRDRLVEDFPEENHGEDPLFRVADLLIADGFNREDHVLVNISW